MTKAKWMALLLVSLLASCRSPEADDAPVVDTHWSITVVCTTPTPTPAAKYSAAELGRAVGRVLSLEAWPEACGPTDPAACTPGPPRVYPYDFADMPSCQVRSGVMVDRLLPSGVFRLLVVQPEPSDGCPFGMWFTLPAGRVMPAVEERERQVLADATQTARVPTLTPTSLWRATPTLSELEARWRQARDAPTPPRVSMRAAAERWDRLLALREEVRSLRLSLRKGGELDGDVLRRVVSLQVQMVDLLVDEGWAQ